MGELEATMTMAEFYEWQAFAAHHHFPADLIDLHGAMQFALIANVNRASNTSAYDANDYLLLDHLKPAPPPPPTKPAPKPPTIAERMRAMISGG
jgi:hypothetical protein